MEALKRVRTQHRRLFTLACNNFEKEEENLDVATKIMKLQIIEEKAALMINSEENVKQLLYDEKIEEKLLEVEIDESEVYIDRWSSLAQKLKHLSLSEKEDTVSNYSVSQQNTLLHYPKIQLPTFDGNVRNWLCFCGQFQKIDKDPNLDLHDKFAYLSQAMERGSVAEELIKSFPPGGGSYEKALKQLKTRFGKDELLIQVYVRDMLALVLQKQNIPTKSLRKLYDLLESKLRALETLGVTRDKYASMLFPLVESALPEETLRAWERYRSTNRRSRETITDEEQHITVAEKNDLDSILEFLQDEVEAEERMILASQTFDCSKMRTNVRWDNKTYTEKKTANNKLRFGNTAQVPSATDLLTSSRGQKQCIFCFNLHKSGDCLKVRKMPLKERETLTEKSRCCFLCLNPGHQVRNCNVKAGCLSCGKRHHMLLCRNIHPQKSPPFGKETVVTENNPGKDHALANVSKSPNVILQTLMVILRGNGKRREARAIIDSASQRSYVLKNTAKEMGYQAGSYEYLQHSLFGGNNTEVCKHDVFTVYLSSVEGTYNCNFKVLSQPVICETMPPIAHELCVKELSDCDIHIVDNNEGPIEILIGADIAGKLMTGGYKMLSCGLAAIETRLGWTVMGRVPQSPSNESTSLLITSMLSQNKSVSDLWSLDTLEITDPSVRKTKTELQEAARLHFLDTVSVEDDRFVVHLPWVEDHPPLPDNYDLALKRLNTTIKRLKAQSLYKEYEEVFQNWLKEGIIEEVQDEQVVPIHYLPYRPVIKENSTTRIRPVFDASAKVKGSPSLNDCLEKGENLIELIPSILIRFRSEEIGVIADIRKVFLQISLLPADRDYLRFLWHASEGKLKQYRHCRVVFGVSCSPFLLGSAIQHHLKTVLKEIHGGKSSYPENVIQKLINSFYVDNCVTSVKCKTDLNIFVKVSTEAMAERKFELRGWEHTDPSAIDTAETNVLGMIWNKKSDILRVNTTSLKELCYDKITKRVILSAAHRIFDPIGISCPVVLTPKLLLRNIWKMKITWDDEVDSDTGNEFLKWIRDIAYFERIHLPRFLGTEDVQQCSVHFFCDASKHAYAVAAFIRIETADTVRVRLLQARSRVAPTGKEEITIARLELLAATIASRLSVTILTEVKCCEVYFWTDSSTVLTWITREEPWGIFVYNRVKEIRELTNKETWKHVPGIMNPADLPSRGCSTQYLLKSKWWEGPNWLYLPREEWPNTDFNVNEEEVGRERKKNVISSVSKCLITTALTTDTKDWYYRYFSKYSKIVNLVAWVLRFIKNCRFPKDVRKHGNLDSKEILEAERRVVRLVQEECFLNERDEKLKSLGTFKDENNIIRLKTKLVYRQDSEDFKMPAILPSQHEVVKRLVFYYHARNSHVGTQMLLNILRERFWIPDGRKTIRAVVSKCTVCKRYSAKKLDTFTAPLPENRVREAAVFEVCGVDLAGPLFLKGNQKCWVCLFTCAIYRAVHIELVTAITTEAFLLALRRFIARRGRCEVIYCDNGTNFVGASKLLRALDWNRIVNDTAIRQIDWKFNPPTAPWWGGWWERLIRILKNLLRKVLGRTSLTYEEMTAILCDCESIINSRPLTYVTENDAELVPLSPSMFLQDIKVSGVPDCDAIDHKSLNKRVKHRHSLQRDLRKRFRSEYLGALLQSSENKKPVKIDIGDIVLIGSDNAKRINWPLGRVIETITGKEGVTRLVRLQTAHGQFLRPIQRLYPLEVSSTDPILVSEKLSTKMVENQSTDGVLDNNIKTSPTPEHIKTRAGRVIKIPQRLDL